MKRIMRRIDQGKGFGRSLPVYPKLALGSLLMGALLLAPLTGAPGMARERMLARALTSTGGGCSYETMLALGSVALNGAGEGVGELQAALDAAGFTRGFFLSERACNAAHALIQGTEKIRAFHRFSRVATRREDERVGAFYFGGAL